MRSFQQSLAEFEARHVRVVGVSVDSPAINLEHCRRAGYTFPILSDSRAEVIRRYDLLQAAAGPGGADIARPAEFLLDATGTVRWRNLTDSIVVRARPEQVLKAIDDPGFAAGPAR